MLAEESCSSSRRKKQRLCSAQGYGEIIHQSSTENMIEYGSGEVYDFQKHDPVIPYVNKLRDYWSEGQNAVVFDGKERLVKVVLFVSSLLENMENPMLILASSSTLSLWENEFSKWTKSMNVVMYKGNKDARAVIRDTECYSENGCIKFQVLLSSPDAFVEDMEMFDHIKWELLVIDECQRPIFIPHFKKLGMLMTDMKLLTVSSESADTCQTYRNMLSFLDDKHDSINTVSDKEVHDKINTLKARLSPFIAFECKFDSFDFEEYWVPAHLSSMQMEQYCSILASILAALSSLSKNSSVHDIITQIQKCCDHPYLVDNDLRYSLQETSLTNPLDADINLSGKMQLLDKLLIEIKRCGLRALVLFQSTVNSEKISTANILDDLVKYRFGENSYVNIDIPKIHCAKIKKLLDMFNDAESESFICLCDYSTCYSSITLSRVDVVILFNSGGNPLNEIKLLKKITFDSPCERLQVFRIYSAFTVEEKALILSKQSTNVNYDSLTVYNQMLAWGAPYLFSKVKHCTDAGPTNCSMIEDLVDEFSSLLMSTSVKMGPTNRSMISKAHMQNGAYSGSILLFGETETHTKESWSTNKNLIDKTPSVFWSNLIKQSRHIPEKPCRRLLRRVSKSPQSWFEGEVQNDETTLSFARSKPRSKRKARVVFGRQWAGTSIPFGGYQDETQREPLSFNMTDTVSPSLTISDSVAFNPTTKASQQVQSDQPHTSGSSPLETEVARIQKERERIIKSHEEKKTMLLYECEKEILEIHRKYDAKINDIEMSFKTKVQPLENYQKLVYAHKLLAEVLVQSLHEHSDLKRTN